MIEAVVALAVVTVVLAAIGSLVASNARGVRNLEHRVALVETARLVVTGLPRNGSLSSEGLNGQIPGYRWQTNATPFFGGGPVLPQSPWIPQQVELRVQSPTGAVLSLVTVRLQKRSGRS